MRILVCAPITKPALTSLTSAGFQIDNEPDIGQKRLEDRIPLYDAVIVRGRTKLTRQVLVKARRLKLIARAGVGLDNIDVEYAASKGIQIASTPEALTNAVAEHTFALILALSKNIALADARIKRGEWPKAKLVSNELLGKKLGILGLGRIGQRVARFGVAFGMRILAHDIVPISESILKELGAKVVDLETLLDESDIFTIHTPLTKDTRHLIGAESLALMKSSALLVNTSRGAVVDERALFEALRTGKIGGAGLDVFEQEPPKSSRLIRLPNVICTSHLAGQTREAQDKAGEEVVRLVKQALQKYG